MNVIKKTEQIFEKLELIIDDKNTNDEMKENIRSIINEIDNIFDEMKYTIEELRDELEMYQDNIHSIHSHDGETNYL